MLKTSIKMHVVIEERRDVAATVTENDAYENARCWIENYEDAE